MAAEFIFTVETEQDCLFCGCRPKNETEAGEPYYPMAHWVGGDVNWGDPVFICVNCIGVMADFVGRVEASKYVRLHKAHKSLLDKHDELSNKFAEQSERIKKILEGKKAEISQRKAA